MSIHIIVIFPGTMEGWRGGSMFAITVKLVMTFNTMKYLENKISETIIVMNYLVDGILDWYVRGVG